ncbi:glycosyltransferase [Pelagibacterium sp.]|uniref:glycosyltransferase n=1 Tax=Pelagibacterium sp. TaxID=1967288 RepID=UPI003A8D07C0
MKIDPIENIHTVGGSAAPPRVAIIHYWLVGMRGGEKVLEHLCRMFPQADIYTHVADLNSLSSTLRRHRIIETSVARLPLARKIYPYYLPFMPRALEAIDLTGYDLVISSEAGPAKGVVVPPDAFHLCYVHSPMRYLWDQYHIYRNGLGALGRIAMSLMAPSLRVWDVTSAARVDHFLANSNHVAKRIEKYWRRQAEVVYPPVDVWEFEVAPPEELGDYYLMAGELAPYKRPDLAIETFAKLGKPLVVIGGPDKAVQRLSANRPRNITFLGKVDFQTLKHHMARCKALIFPGEEDFGIIPVEVMASGRPVLAYGRGGALDTVVDGRTGLLFKEQSVDSLIGCVQRFETLPPEQFDPAALRAHAEGFAPDAFHSAIEKALATRF